MAAQGKFSIEVKIINSTGTNIPIREAFVIGRWIDGEAATEGYIDHWQSVMVGATSDDDRGAGFNMYLPAATGSISITALVSPTDKHVRVLPDERAKCSPIDDSDPNHPVWAIEILGNQ